MFDIQNKNNAQKLQTKICEENREGKLSIGVYDIERNDINT